jgi:hypothetical protein
MNGIQDNVSSRIGRNDVHNSQAPLQLRILLSYCSKLRMQVTYFKFSFFWWSWIVTPITYLRSHRLCTLYTPPCQCIRLRISLLQSRLFNHMHRLWSRLFDHIYRLWILYVWLSSHSSLISWFFKLYNSIFTMRLFITFNWML